MVLGLYLAPSQPAYLPSPSVDVGKSTNPGISASAAICLPLRWVDFFLLENFTGNKNMKKKHQPIDGCYVWDSMLTKWTRFCWDKFRVGLVLGQVESQVDETRLDSNLASMNVHSKLSDQGPLELVVSTYLEHIDQMGNLPLSKHWWK